MTLIFVTMPTWDKASDAELGRVAKELRLERLRRLGRRQTCDQCHEEFLARSGARFCSGRCRTAAYRRRLRGAA